MRHRGGVLQRRFSSWRVAVQKRRVGTLCLRFALREGGGVAWAFHGVCLLVRRRCRCGDLNQFSTINQPFTLQFNKFSLPYHIPALKMPHTTPSIAQNRRIKKHNSRALVGGLNDESNTYNVLGNDVNLASECGNVCKIRNVCEEEANCFRDFERLKMVIISAVGWRWVVIFAGLIGGGGDV